ncbi:MAG: HIT family protein [Actinomycetes bacterium]
MTRAAGCLTCEQESSLDTALPWQRIALDDDWRVTHSFNTCLPGWLVLLPRRHVLTIAELTDREARSLGVWLVRLSRAPRAVTGRVKTAQFAEADGLPVWCTHVHVHVVPRTAELAGGAPRPPSVRHDRPPETSVGAEEMDTLAHALSRQLNYRTSPHPPLGQIIDC